MKFKVGDSVQVVKIGKFYQLYLTAKKFVYELGEDMFTETGRTGRIMESRTDGKRNFYKIEQSKFWWHEDLLNLNEEEENKESYTRVYRTHNDREGIVVHTEPCIIIHNADFGFKLPGATFTLPDNKIALADLPQPNAGKWTNWCFYLDDFKLHDWSLEKPILAPKVEESEVESNPVAEETVDTAEITSPGLDLVEEEEKEEEVEEPLRLFANVGRHKIEGMSYQTGVYNGKEWHLLLFNAEGKDLIRVKNGRLQWHCESINARFDIDVTEIPQPLSGRWKAGCVVLAKDLAKFRTALA